MKELFIEAKLENMETVMAFINAQLEDSPELKDCSLEIKHQVGIAVDEVFSNISRYAYHPLTGSVAVRIAIDNNINIEFEDSGMAYDPFSADTPDISLSVEERKVGGLGIFMLRKLMDSVEYRREENKNILLIKKKIANKNGC